MVVECFIFQSMTKINQPCSRSIAFRTSNFKVFKTIEKKVDKFK